LFTAIILSPYLERDTITNIFHKDILNDASLKHLFNDLAGWSKEKPFECVGTIDEVNLALTLSAEKWGKPLPFLLASSYKYAEPATTKTGSVSLFNTCIFGNLKNETA
jgi:hypothetical protein